jgi:hypothetical protein
VGTWECEQGQRALPSANLIDYPAYYRSAIIPLMLPVLLAIVMTLTVSFLVLAYGIGWVIAAVGLTALVLSILLPLFFNGGDGK